MRNFALAAASLTFAVAAFASGCTGSDDSGVNAESSDITSCEGAHWDAGGRCRRSNGWFAAKACCEALALAPGERRNLDAYTCPEDPPDAGIPVAFFDADSTLRVTKSGSVTPNDVDDVYVLPFAAETIKQLNAEGYLVAVVSNQGGVAAGYTTLEVAEGGLVTAITLLTDLGAKIDYLDFADQKDDFRKPKTGMPDLLDELLVDKCGVGVDYSNSFMVGDAGYKKDVDGPHPDGRPADDFSNSDRGLAENLEIPFFEPTDYFGWREYGIYNIHKHWELSELLENIEEVADELEANDDDPERVAALRAEVASNREANGL